MQKKKQSILLTKGISKVVVFGNGGRTTAGHSYMYLLGDLSDSNQKGVKGIYAFALPFKTELHLLGIPANEEGRQWSQQSGMETVRLEGNYPDYFTLYAEEGQQSLTRYHIDPQVMVFSIDFIKNMHWEIVNNTLYFLDNELLPSLDIADEFIRMIKPAFTPTPKLEPKLFVSRIGEELKDSALDLKCPICQVELMLGKKWLACPEGHGYLISGTEMLDVRKDKAHIVKELSEVFGRPPKVISKVVNVQHEELHCPHCSHAMRQANYQNTEIILDICSYCPYRWIDGGELDVVLGKYRHETYS